MNSVTSDSVASAAASTAVLEAADDRPPAPSAVPNDPATTAAPGNGTAPRAGNTATDGAKDSQTIDLSSAHRDACACGDVAWLLSRASHALAAALGRALEALGVGMRGFVVLKMLSRSRVPTQLALAQSTGIDKTTLVSVLDQLEARQLVQRSPDPRDRRARVVKLTDHGRYMLEVAETTVRDVEVAVLDCIPPDDREPLLRALPNLVDATDALGTGGGSCL